MSTNRYHESVDAQPTTDRLAQLRRKKDLEFAKIAVLFFLVVMPLAFIFGTPNREPDSTSPGFSDSTPVLPKPVETPRKTAISVIRPIGNSGVSGLLHFDKVGDGFQVHGEIDGLTPGKYRLLIHARGDSSDTRTVVSAENHTTPCDAHDANQRLVRLVGNIQVDNGGRASVDFRDTIIQSDGASSIIGGTVVIYACTNRLTRAAGMPSTRVAVGVIGIAASE